MRIRTTAGPAFLAGPESRQTVRGRGLTLQV
jgi:hypothetical protein